MSYEENCLPRSVKTICRIGASCVTSDSCRLLSASHSLGRFEGGALDGRSRGGGRTGFLASRCSSSLTAAGIGCGCSFVGPFPPLKCFEQTYVSLVMLSVPKSFLPQFLIQILHFSRFVFGLGKGMKNTPCISGRFPAYRESLLHVP